MTPVEQTIIKLLTEIRDELQKPDAGEEAARQQALYNANRFQTERALGMGHAIYGPGGDDYGRNKKPWDYASSGDPYPPDYLMQDNYLNAIPLPPQRAAGSAKMNGPLPDPAATPGAVNLDVMPETLHETIGKVGWTATVRPPVSYTGPLKVQKMIEYGCTGSPDEYELDHLVPLCCGGHPFDERNLWPQPRAGLLGARTKDITEVAAQHAILSGVYQLSAIQLGFQKDWVALHTTLLANPKMQSLMMAVALPEQEP